MHIPIAVFVECAIICIALVVGNLDRKLNRTLDSGGISLDGIGLDGIRLDGISLDGISPMIGFPRFHKYKNTQGNAAGYQKLAMSVRHAISACQRDI